MPTTPPTFTATPVVVSTDLANMPQALGPRIGASADANFAAMTTYANNLQTTDFRATAILTPATFVTASSNYEVRSGSFYTRGNLRWLKLAIANGSATQPNPPALVSSATGAITSTTLATLITAYRPPYDLFLFANTGASGPPFNMSISTAGVIAIKGSSQPNFTYASTSPWVAGIEAVWLA